MTTTNEKQTTIRLGNRETTWSDLLRDAVSTPGKLLEAYTALHNYSVGNSLLALFQCYDRGITPGPLNTYKGWQQLGRQVRKGEKAIVLYMPLAYKKRVSSEIQDAEESGTDQRAENEKDVCDEVTRYRFALRPYWFVLAQTDGETAFTPTIPGFDLATALQELRIQQVDFESINGNAQGYAFERSIAINPLAQLPQKTTFHELAHIVLGHTEEGQLVDSDLTPRNIREVEAESVALICCESLQLAGSEYARGYIQNWLSGDGISHRSAQKIFSAASAILKAGRGESASRESGLGHRRRVPTEGKPMITNVIASLPHRKKAEKSTHDLPYNRGSMKATKPLTINSIDVDNDEELDALMDQVLAEGDKVYEAQYKEALRLGIIDEKGHLLKHELPEDMREDAGTDFGG